MVRGLPQAFKVGVTVTNVAGGGTLTVAPGRLVLQVGPLSRRLTDVQEIEHSHRTVTLLKGRILPPYLNTHLVIDAGDVVGLAGLPGWKRNRLRAALRAAGFVIDERSGWLLTGSQFVRPWFK
jgi:hypothetical protein